MFFCLLRLLLSLFHIFWQEKSITEPIIIPIKLRIKPNPFPKTKAPAGQVNAPGIIGITVWIICIRIKTQGAPFPRESKKAFSFSWSVNNPILYPTIEKYIVIITPIIESIRVM